MLAEKSLFIFLIVSLLLICVGSNTRNELEKCDERPANSWLCEYHQINSLEKETWCEWLEGPEVRNFVESRKVGEPVACDELSGCEHKFKIDFTRSAENRFDFGIQTRRALSNLIDSGLTSLGQDDKSIADGASRSQFLTCHIEAGHKAEVWLNWEMQEFRGKIRSNGKQIQLKIHEPRSEKCHESEGSIVFPVIDVTINQLSGPVECRQMPIVDLHDHYFYNNHIKMKEGCELDLANTALDKMLETVPPFEQNVKTTAKGCGKEVFVVAHCFYLEDNKHYEARCKACVKFARENILSRGGNAYGINWRLDGCFLRFEFYDFD